MHHCDFFANSDISMCSSFIHFATHISIINSVMGVLTLAQATGYVDRDIAVSQQLNMNEKQHSSIVNSQRRINLFIHPSSHYQWGLRSKYNWKLIKSLLSVAHYFATEIKHCLDSNCNNTEPHYSKVLGQVSF